jgi:hypothetical protein
MCSRTWKVKPSKETAFFVGCLTSVDVDVEVGNQFNASEFFFECVDPNIQGYDAPPPKKGTIFCVIYNHI